MVAARQNTPKPLSGCPLYPRKQTSELRTAMSALGQKRKSLGSIDRLVGAHRSDCVRKGAGPDRSSEYPKIDRPLVMRDRRDTDKLLGSVEQRRELRSRSFEG